MKHLWLGASLLVVAVASSGCGTTPVTCGPTNCQGCCTATDQCVTGTALNACGSAGSVCADCTTFGRCGFGGLCENTGGTGGGSATGGGTGTGGGSTGGGTGGGSVTGGGGGDTGGGTGGGSVTGGGGGSVTGGGGGSVTGGGTGGGVTGGGGGSGIPAGDSCGAPIDIVLANGVGAALGNRSNATDDTTATCGGGGAGDIVFRFTTPTVGALTVDLRPSDTQQRLVASIRSACDQATTELPGTCVSAASAGGGALIVQRTLPAGTYFLIVDGANTAAGPLAVSLTFANDVGDVCATPVPLAFTNTEVTAVGSTAGATADGTASCGGAGPDMLYRFDVTAPGNLDVTLNPRNVNVQPVVYLRSTTCTGAQTACAVASTAGGSANFRLQNIAMGTYFLWVDSASANAGDYVLQARLTPPLPGDYCSVARPLVFSMGTDGGTATEAGDTTAAFSDVTASCGAGTSGDLVYSFTTTSPLDLRASASTPSGTYRPALSLRTASCIGSEYACNAAATPGTAAQIAQGSLPPGTWYLWVDGAANTNGPFTLNASLTAPLPGDGCSAPRPLVFSNGGAGGTATDTGDTTPYFGEQVGSCSASNSGSDMVYSFTTTTTLDLRVDVTTTSGTYRPVLYLRNTSCVGVERSCAAAATAGPVSLNAGGLPPGTYFLFVDGAASTAGSFNLSATLTPPAPGDGCTSPTPLVFSSGVDGGTATASGSTTNFFHDAVGTCASGSANDALYAFSTTSTLDFRATATTSSSTYQPVLYLRTGTCTGGQWVCGAATVAGGSATIGQQSLPAGNYFLWVDGALGTSGPFNLSASLAAPIPGESCTSARTLTFTNGAASATGDTTFGYDDAVSSCATASGGFDQVFTFTTASQLDFVATLSTTSSTARPVMYLRNTSCNGVERSCNAAVVAGGQASLGVQGLPAGTYYLWVDTQGGGAPFSLTANLGAAPPDAVRPLPITNVAVPGPMQLTYEVVDRFGNVVTTDNTTSFTVNVSGTAVIASSSTGTIVSGAGTNSAVVRVAGGRITLGVTNTTAQTVVFTTVDSQPNGLRYPGMSFSQTSPSQAMPCDGLSATYNFPTVGLPTGAGTVTVTGRGDFSATSTEYAEVFMENTTTGVNLGRVFSPGPGQCLSTDSSSSVAAPQATLQTAAADGTISVVVRSTTSVNCSVCTGAQSTVTLTYPSNVSGTFQ